VERDKLRKVEYKHNQEIKIGWFHTWEQMMANTRINGGIEDMEAFMYALVEDENGKIYEIESNYIKFI